MNLKILLLFLLNFQLLYTQNCENSGFENGTFEGWEAYVGNTSGIDYSNNGVVIERHTIIDSVEFDFNTGYQLSTFPQGGAGDYIVRIGNSNVNSEAEVLRKKILVTEFNKLFLYQYAVVLQDPGHDPIDQPKFQVKLYDADNNVVMPEECGIYTVVAGPETNEWGRNDTLDVKFKNWTTVGVDLTDYLNEEITIEFYVQDCSQGGHFGYAYINASCNPLQFNINSYCPVNNLLSISGPEGFASYDWSISTDSTFSIETTEAINGETTVLNLTSETGCITSITQKIEGLEPVSIGRDTILCQVKEFQISTKVDIDRYFWSTGDTTQLITIYDSGDYFISNMDSSCFDSDTIHVEFTPFAEIGEIPNVFTPNSDSINDEFYFYSSNLENFVLNIFNRWGNQLFETRDPNDFWDAYYKNEIVEEGLYFYKIDYKINCNSERNTIHGNVTINY